MKLLEKIDKYLNEKSKSTQMECMECGHKFKRKLTQKSDEVKCPKCGSYDISDDV